MRDDRVSRAKPAFIADAHLGKLARHLRFGGWDTLYFPSIADGELLNLARIQERILLTRDRGIHLGKGVRLHRLEAEELLPALIELAETFDLADTYDPFTRCMVCNTELQPIEADAVRGKVPPLVSRHFHTFKTCPHCQRIYWPGDHYQRMLEEWKEIFTQVQNK
ncbi:Mut7-C RNAse domain-containing protein [Nitratifractor salsuginis]|nr:Mut7-C RNAse domain-containing protein [Nitratifractor salsuginis]